MSLKYKHSSKTKVQWLELDPIIVQNEIIIEKDTGFFKFGDGVSKYSELKYSSVPATDLLGTIEANSPAPTPGKSGYYKFVSTGVKPSWLIASNEEVEVKLNDLVVVIFENDEYEYKLVTNDDKLSFSEIVNDLISGGENMVLSAEQGLILNTKISQVTDDVAIINKMIEDGTIGGGSGGSGNVGSLLRVLNLISSTLAVAKDTNLNLQYSFSSIDTLTEVATGPGTAAYHVDNNVVYASSIQQGTVVFNIAPYLHIGNNAIKVIVTDAYGASRNINYTINVVSLTITSTFDSAIAYDSAITFKYVPVGSLEKITKFILDGVEIGSQTTTRTGIQQTFVIPQQAHGHHILEVSMTATVSGIEIPSNVLRYDLICIENGNQSVIIASDFNKTVASQYETLTLNYLVYNPTASTQSVVLSVNGVQTSLVVDRTLQKWNVRINSTDALSLILIAGEVSRTFEVLVTNSIITAVAETADLQLFLTSAGRSNSEINKNVWTFGNISAQLTGFNYTSDGWVVDAEGYTALRVGGDARVTIPFNIFDADFRIYGKTIEFEFSTKNVMDYDTIVLQCFDGLKGIKLTPQSSLFKSEQSTVTAQFKEDERVRLSFVIDEENRLIYTYINGIISGLAQYPADDNFMQLIPVGISIGSSDATIDIYNIRIYNNNLNQFQIIDNFTADTDNVDKKLKLFNDNLIYDDYGNIDYGAVVERIPCMIITGDLPGWKGDKKTVSVSFENRQDNSRSFTCTGTSIDVQGTSSQYYPRKNYKIKFGKGVLTMEEGGVVIPKGMYQLRSNSVPVPDYTMKADFAESSGTHNTGLAKFIDKINKDSGLLTPPQKLNSKIRTTVDGYPIVMFHRATTADPISFLGKYNFNIDKGSTDAFGFNNAAIQESWEFLNNTDSICLFRSNDFTTTYYDTESQTNIPIWYNSLEARYPDAYRNPTKLQILFDWVLSTNPDTATNVAFSNPVDFGELDSLGNHITYAADDSAYRIAKFKNECGLHFNKNFLLTYYVITELFAMVDQRAKNQFLTTWGPEPGSTNDIWYMIFYDNDTALGINNEGRLMFDYAIEFHDTQSGSNVWNGESSLLWNNVEKAFSTEIATIYKNLRQTGVITYEEAFNQLLTEQSAKWCEALYNFDAKFKYVDPAITGFFDYGTNTFKITSEYLYEAQGSRAEHRKWWLFNRFRYMDSKYNAANYFSDTAVFRTYTPQVSELNTTEENEKISASLAVVPANVDFHLTTFIDQYLRVKLGSTIKSMRGKRNLPYVINFDSGVYNDMETIIYGSSKIKDFGDLAPKYPGTVDMSNATKLTNLKIGDANPAYYNPNLHSLSLGNNTLLKVLDFRNTPNLSNVVNVEGCINIEEIYATGSGISSITLPNGGNLKKLHLPGTITFLDLRNKSLTDFQITSVGNITSLRLENVSGINIYNLFKMCTDITPIKLERIRVIGISGTGTSIEPFYKVAQLNGIDANGYTTPHPVIVGSYTVVAAKEKELAAVNISMPELIISYTNLAIDFLDPEVERVLLSSSINSNHDGYIYKSEIESVTGNWGSIFQNNVVISKFPEFERFIGITGLQAYYGFSGCTNLESIVLPPNTTYIGNSVFKNCTKLISINIPGKVTSVQASAFENTKLVSLTIPASLISWDSTALNGVSTLKTVISLTKEIFIAIPSASTNVIESVTIPEDIKVLGVAFRGCTNLLVNNGNVRLTSLTSMTAGCFENLPKLYSVDLTGSSITSFSSYGIYAPFKNCSALTTVVLNAALTAIPDGCFGLCPSLASLTCLSVTPPTLVANAITNNTNLKIYVPDDSVNTYKSATNWSTYSSKIYPLSTKP